MNIETINFVKNLPKDEKAELLEYITIDLSEEEDDLIYAELERRSAEYDKNPSTAKSWDEAKAYILKKYEL